MPSPTDLPKFLKDAQTAKVLGVTKMTIRRWHVQPELNFPAPTVINGINYNETELVFQWMRARVVKRVQSQSKGETA